MIYIEVAIMIVVIIILGVELNQCKKERIELNQCKKERDSYIKKIKEICERIKDRK